MKSFGKLGFNHWRHHLFLVDELLLIATELKSISLPCQIRFLNWQLQQFHWVMALLAIHCSMLLTLGEVEAESILEMFSELHTGFPFLPCILSNATYSTAFPISIGFIQVRLSCMKILQKFSVTNKMKPDLVTGTRKIVCCDLSVLWRTYFKPLLLSWGGGRGGEV